ncbi:MAG: hypothetical protein SGPRY_014533 [Prymnesium sp.]
MPRADWASHRHECHEFASASLGGERETTMPVDFARRFQLLQRDALELLRIARQESCPASRALSCLATSWRCVCASGVTGSALKRAERVELSTVCPLVLVEFARAHASVHIIHNPRRCEAVCESARCRLQALIKIGSASGAELPACVKDWCELEIARLAGRIQLQLGDETAARKQYGRALVLSSRPSEGVHVEEGLDVWLPSSIQSQSSRPDLSQLARIDARKGDAPIKADSYLNQAIASSSPQEGRELRREIAQLTHFRLHRTRLEVNAIVQQNPEIMEATRRSELRDEHWDRIVELQRDCQSAERQCASMWRQLLEEAVDADDAFGWSRAAAPFARFLKGEGEEREAHVLALKIIKLHVCGGKCRDVRLAGAITTTEGAVLLV